MKLFCIVGETASGKDTLVTRLMKEFPDKFKPICSYTTRPIRESETEGKEHYFVSQEEFDSIMCLGDIIAYTKIEKGNGSGYEYLATYSEIEAGKNIYVIDPNGIKDLKSRYPELELFTICITAPERERIQRAVTNRGQSVEDILKRIENEKEQFMEFRNNHMYNAIIFNPNGEENDAYNKLKEIILRNYAL